MLTNTRDRWGSVSKSFHWGIAILIVAAVPAGYLMSYTYPLAFRDKAVLPLHYLASQIHHTVGLTILALVILRLAWRLTRPAPAGPTPHVAFERMASNGVHALLYALLFLLPLSGWAALSVYGEAPIWLFNLKGVVPGILPKLPLTSPFGYGLFAHIHVWALWAGAVVLGVHILAALWHHWVFKDNVLVRMWPLGRTSRAPPLS